VVGKDRHRWSKQSARRKSKLSLEPIKVVERCDWRARGSIVIHRAGNDEPRMGSILVASYETRHTATRLADFHNALQAPGSTDRTWGRKGHMEGLSWA